MTMGDPAGVGPIIAWKAVAGAQARPVGRSTSSRRPTCWRRYGACRQAAQIIPGSGSSASTIVRAAALAQVLPIHGVDCTAPAPGEPDPATAPAIIESIRLAVEHTRAGKAAGVVTNPIAKALLYRAGFKHPGHTEYLAELAADGGDGPRR